MTYSQEERRAWDQYFAACIIRNGPAWYSECSAFADEMLAERRKRFPTPCPACEGEGVIDGEECDRCEGGAK